MTLQGVRILVTGADGFIGKNLAVRLTEMPDVGVERFVRGDEIRHLKALIERSDAIVHLAGENRPVVEAAFDVVNSELTRALCDLVKERVTVTGRHLPLIFASSSQAERDSPYGRSKRAAERYVEQLARETNNPCVVYRFPGVFGKWSRPNYNSVVATFCYNLARNLPIQVNDAEALLPLVYIDDVVSAITKSLMCPSTGFQYASVEPEYLITVGELASQIKSFVEYRENLFSARVGEGLTRALYATFVSFLPVRRFSYDIPQYSDARGVFVEMLKTADSGQFSYFTAKSGVTRGGHYHHTKTEKFLVIKGSALFRFRNLVTDEFLEFCTSGDRPQVVDTIPGWAHDITNVGDDEMIVMLWANENFNRQQPDTVSVKV